MNKLKDTDSKKTEVLSNKFNDLTMNLKKVVESAFTKITNAGKQIDNEISVLRNSLLERALYQIDNFNKGNNSKVVEEFKKMISKNAYIETLYDLAEKKRADYRDTYFAKSLDLVAKSVVLLGDALRNDKSVKVHILSKNDLDKNNMLITTIGNEKNTTTYRMYENDLVVEYNYLVPTFKTLNKEMSTKTNKVYDEEDNTNNDYIPLTHTALNRLYAKLYGEQRDGEELDTPNAIDGIDGFVNFVNNASKGYNTMN